jgi:hypothetical protein
MGQQIIPYYLLVSGLRMSRDAPPLYPNDFVAGKQINDIFLLLYRAF